MRRGWRRLPGLAGAAFLWCLWPLACLAHLMPQGKGTLNLVGAQAYVVLSIPAQALAIDANCDGRLQAAEWTPQAQARAAEQFRRQVHLDSAQGRAEWAEVLPNLSLSGHEDGSPDLVFMAVARWHRAPHAFTLALDWPQALAPTPLAVRATVTEGAQTVYAEVGLLGEQARAHEFRAPPSRVLARFAEQGLRHVLGGADHVLFLLTLLLAHPGWRRWLWLLSLFTVGHGVSYGLAGWGWVSVPAVIVEPLIAASIVAMALLHWRRVPLSLRLSSALVLALGGLHGLGFASAMGMQTLHPGHPAWSLLGFNLGVEAGQALVALGLGLLGLLAARVPAWAGRWQRACTAAAGFMGLWWLFERTVLA